MIAQSSRKLARLAVRGDEYELARSILDRQLSQYHTSCSTPAAAEATINTSSSPAGPGLSKWLRDPESSLKRSATAGPSVHIQTYGCQQNVADSEVVMAVLAAHGYSQAASPAEADVVLLNTCSIREKAEAKIFSRLGVLRKLKQERNALSPAGERGTRRGKGPIVGILGCMAERLKERLLDTDRLADIVAGPDAYRDLPRLLSAVQAGSGSRPEDAMNVQLSLEETYADIVPLRPAGANAAFLSIMRGCNNMCSFCVVPFTRGRERSRGMASILDEVKVLAEQGVKEVTLLGQNVNSYSDFSQVGKWQPPTDGAFGVYAPGFRSVYRPQRSGAVRFAELLDAVADIDPEMRICFTSPHPKDFSDEVLDVIRTRPNVAKMVHMPAQSGSSRILAAMRRGYTRQAYDALASKMRQTIPQVALSTDMIVGFCGESEEDHLGSVDLMRVTAYEQAFLFAYSRRDRTHAARHLEDDVPAAVKSRRLSEIITVFREAQAAQNRLELGRLHLVLVEGQAKDGALLTGRTANMKRVKVPDVAVPPSLLSNGGATVNLQAGNYAAVRVTGSSTGTLFAEALARTSVQEFLAANDSVLPISDYHTMAEHDGDAEEQITAMA